MSSEILRPVGDSTIGNPGTPWPAGAFVTGDAPQLGDQDDETFARVEAGLYAGIANDRIVLSSLATGTGRHGATAMRIHVRAAVEAFSSSAVIPDDLRLTAFGFASVGGADVFPVDTAEILDRVFEVSPAAFPDEDPAPILAFIDSNVTAAAAGGLPFAAAAQSDTAGTYVRFYEVALEFVYDDDLACVRLYPREDGRGISSAPRIYPPPRSGRIVGGHDLSRRLT